MGVTKPKYIEDQHCVALCRWASYIPLLSKYLYHIPNGGNRNTGEAKKLKDMGVRAGVSDYHLPVPRGSFVGLYLEMKPPKPHKSKVEPSQRKWGEAVIRQGHAFYVVYGWGQAKTVLEWYLALPEPELKFEQPPIEAILEGAL